MKSANFTQFWYPFWERLPSASPFAFLNYGLFHHRSFSHRRYQLPSWFKSCMWDVLRRKALECTRQLSRFALLRRLSMPFNLVRDTTSRSLNAHLGKIQYPLLQWPKANAMLTYKYDEWWYYLARITKGDRLTEEDLKSLKQSAWRRKPTRKTVCLVINHRQRLNILRYWICFTNSLAYRGILHAAFHLDLDRK